MIFHLYENYYDFNLLQESRHEAYRKALPERLAKFSKFLGENDWLAGENVSFSFFI